MRLDHIHISTHFAPFIALRSARPSLLAVHFVHLSLDLSVAAPALAQSTLHVLLFARYRASNFERSLAWPSVHSFIFTCPLFIHSSVCLSVCSNVPPLLCSPLLSLVRPSFACLYICRCHLSKVNERRTPRTRQD